MKKIVIINASPRRKNNTSSLLDEVKRGIEDAGGEAVEYRLYDYKYTGCRECMACKLKNSKFHNHCAVKDELSPVLEASTHANAIVFGTPIFYDSISGMLHSYLERLLFPVDTYLIDHSRPKTGDFPPRKSWREHIIPVAGVFTMNVHEEAAKTYYQPMFNSLGNYCRNIMGSYEALYSYDTKQFKDYSRYDIDYFSADEKQKQHDTQFPKDLQSAYELGKKMVLQNL